LSSHKLALEDLNTLLLGWSSEGEWGL